MIVHAALDLIGALLCNREGLTGITHLAVGAGDPAWDAAPPSPDPGRRSLVDEVWRVRLEPERDLRLDAEAGRIRVRATIPPGRATGTLREVGVFGGDASARPEPASSSPTTSTPRSRSRRAPRSDASSSSRCRRRSRRVRVRSSAVCSPADAVSSG